MSRLLEQKRKKSQMPVHAVINTGRQFSSVLARWRHRLRVAGGSALSLGHIITIFGPDCPRFMKAR